MVQRRGQLLPRQPKYICCWSMSCFPLLPAWHKGAYRRLSGNGHKLSSFFRVRGDGRPTTATSALYI